MLLLARLALVLFNSARHLSRLVSYPSRNPTTNHPNITNSKRTSFQPTGRRNAHNPPSPSTSSPSPSRTAGSSQNPAPSASAPPTREWPRGRRGSAPRSASAACPRRSHACAGRGSCRTEGCRPGGGGTGGACRLLRLGTSRAG